MNDTYFEKELKTLYKEEDGIYFSNEQGYWSNLDLNENKNLIEALKKKSALEALREHQPQYEKVIYSPMRPAGLELLDLKGNETCIDYGCMWGAITIPLAKRTKAVLGVDQTLDSLKFLKARISESQCHNISLLNQNIKQMPALQNKADIAIVNGVLEWVPEQGNIELKKYFGKYENKNYQERPRDIQKLFLKKVYENLNVNGKLYLAIENRYDLFMFLGKIDPHANLRFTTLLPRPLSNIISKVFLGRPYRTWIYSFVEIKKLLQDSGFSKVDLYMCFPNYRFPEKIMPFERSNLKTYTSYISLNDRRGINRLIWSFIKLFDIFMFRYLRLKWLAPSIIAIAHK